MKGDRMILEDTENLEATARNTWENSENST